MGTGPSGWTGKYAIPEEEYDAFLTLAHNHIFKQNKACSLLEKHLPQSPILIDLDFRYAAGGPLRRRFTTEHLRRFVAAYADAYARFFEPTESALQFFVMVKPAPEADAAHDAHKDGVHIVCPTITTRPEIQYALRGYLLQTGAIETIFGDTGMTNTPQDCLDISVIQRNNWFLYGACKPDKAWYKVENVYGALIPATIPEEINEPLITTDHLEEESIETWSSLDLIKLLSIRNGHATSTELALRIECPAREADWIQLLQRWGKGSNFARNPKSPGLFSKQTGGADIPAMTLDNKITHTTAGAAEEMIQMSGISVRSGFTADDIAMAYRLARECLNPERRCGEYHDWINIALCLKNISDTEESYRVWCDITRRVNSSHKKAKMTEAELKAKWAQLPAIASSMNQGRKPLLMGSLINWSREDSPETFRAITMESNKNWAILNDSGSHVSVAELVVRMYRHEFRCTPLKKGATAASMDWYQFAGHTWRNLKTWMRIRERLSNEVRNLYIQADREVGDRITRALNDDERQRNEAKRKNLLKVESSLMSSGFKDSVMKELAEKFYDEEFLQHMNTDPELVGFADGVLELRHMGPDGQPHIMFRPGRPDDCVSFQMGRGLVGMDAIPYIAYDPANTVPEHAEIFDFFKKIYPDPVLREYVLTLLSSCLEGANREQKFYIMTGVGSNGKSKLVELMNTTFGEYQETLATTALTRKRADAGAANPELIVLKSKRFVSMSEPDEGEKINTSSMKQLSGEDIVKARALFSDQDAFVIMAKIFMLCNDLPPVSSMDNGTWRRLRVIPHVAKFVDHGLPIDPANNVHHKDLLLDGKIRRWRPYFAGILAWYYENHYLRHGLKEPDQVTAASSKYKEENDSFAAFCQECFIKEAGAELRANDILTRYKEWMRFNPGKKLLQKTQLLQRMSETYGKPIDPSGKVYAGVRIAEEGEDISGNVIGPI
jgi:P4 family phage/plasmid primase-like protien